MKQKIILQLLILLFVACKKNSSSPADETITLKFKPEGLEFIQLTISKYFIYKDSASGNLDSVTVVKSLLENQYTPAHHSEGVFDPDIPAFNIQVFTLILEDQFYQEWFRGNATATGASSIIASSDSSNIDLREPDAGTAFYYPADLLIPSITIEGKTYTDVIKHINNNGLGMDDPGYKKSTYYWAKQIGIIKREVVTTNGSVKTITLLRNN
jgi:hypothetical protein